MAHVRARRAAAPPGAAGGRRGALLLAGLGAGALAGAGGARPARALIPDDDDEVLLQRAKARRQQRIQTELQAEKDFVKSEGFTRTLADKKELAAIQTAVNQMLAVGGALDAGDVRGAAALVAGDGEGEGWVGGLKQATSKIDKTDNLKQEADGIFSGLSGISPAQGLDKSKASFVDAATSLQAWCNTAGVASSIQGL